MFELWGSRGLSHAGGSQFLWFCGAGGLKARTLKKTEMLAASDRHTDSEWTAPGSKGRKGLNGSNASNRDPSTK
eukprot:1947206-Amphidinium_carterae.1